MASELRSDGLRGRAEGRHTITSEGVREWTAHFLRLARQMQIDLGERPAEQLSLYLGELLHWNERINLVAGASPRVVITQHFLDSLSCLKELPGSGWIKCVDVGSGAGFPGLVVRIARSAPTELVLIESSAKKCAFLKEVTAKLALSDAAVVRGRAETVARQSSYRESFDFAFCRAVADFGQAVKYCLPFLKVGGRMLAQRGSRGAEEAEGAAPLLNDLAAAVLSVRRVMIPGARRMRTIVLVVKMGPSRRSSGS